MSFADAFTNMKGKENLSKDFNNKIDKAVKNAKEQEKQKEKAQEKANFDNHKKQSGGTKSEGGVVGKATAPYNFIPLNHKNEFAKFKKPNDFDNFNGISGEINLTITTKTPFFIGDNEKKSDEDYKEFFMVNGKPQIPGSSLRGMIRNLVEIVSYGKFENTNLTTFYYRNMAGKGESTLKAEYARIMSSKDKDGVPRPNAKFGYFVREGERKYAIYKATKEQAHKCSIYKDNHLKGFSELEKRPNALKLCQEIADKSMKINLVGDKYIVYTGVTTKDIKNNNIKSAKKSYFTFKKLSKDELKALDKISLDYELIELYEADNKRQPQRGKKFLNLVDLSKEHKTYPNGVPCFFIEHERAGVKYVFFGHTPYFRIPYFKSVKEHIPEYEFGENDFDLTECIFGKESEFASRVFFEDANLTSDLKDVFQKETRTQNLQGPKPTSYNMYLENSLKSKVYSLLTLHHHYNV